MRRRTLLFVAFFLVTVGCKKDEKPATAPLPPPKVSPALPLMDKLAYEAAHRADAGTTVEGFWAALEKNGLTVTDQKQHVGSVFGARYCVGAVTSGVHVDLCEYDTEADAMAGAAKADRAFVNVANLKHVAHHAAVLSTRPDEVTPATDEAVKKITDVFDAQ